MSGLAGRVDVISERFSAACPFFPAPALLNCELPSPLLLVWTRAVDAKNLANKERGSCGSWAVISQIK